MIISLVIVSACATNPQTEGIHIPNSIDTNVREYFYQDSHYLCFDFSQEQFWISNTYAEELSTHLLENISLYIDGVALRNDELDIIRSDMGHTVVENGEIVGTYGGVFSVCTTTSNQTHGSHVAILNIKDLSDQLRSYTWEYVVENQ